jgi:hypothetical protein
MLEDLVAVMGGGGGGPAPDEPPRPLRFSAREVKLDEVGSFVLVHEASMATEQMFLPGGSIRPNAQARCFVDAKSDLAQFYARYNIQFAQRTGRYILGWLQMRIGDDDYDEDEEEEEEEPDYDDDDDADPGDVKDASDAPAKPVDSAVVIDLTAPGQSVANRFTPKPKPATAVETVAPPPPAPAYTIKREDSYLEVPPGHVALYVHMTDSLRQPQTVFASLERHFMGVEQTMAHIKQELERQKTITISGNGVMH